MVTTTNAKKSTTARKRTTTPKKEEPANTVGILIKGAESVQPETVEAVRDALLGLMQKAFDTHMPESVTNNVITTFREATSPPAPGYNTITHSSINMGASTSRFEDGLKKNSYGDSPVGGTFDTSGSYED